RGMLLGSICSLKEATGGQKERIFNNLYVNARFVLAALLIGVFVAGDIVESSGMGYTNKHVLVEVIRVSVLVILLSRVSVRKVIEVIKKGFTNTYLKGYVVLWVYNVFESATKRNSQLNVAVFFGFNIIAGNTEKPEASKQVRGIAHGAFVVTPI